MLRASTNTCLRVARCEGGRSQTYIRATSLASPFIGTYFYTSSSSSHSVAVSL